MITKITTGFVVQEFDPKTKKFKSQHFVASDESTWTVDGEDVGDLDDALEAEGEEQCEGPEPYLPYNMVCPGWSVMPNPDDLDMCEQLQEDLKTVLDGYLVGWPDQGSAITAACQVIVDRFRGFKPGEGPKSENNESPEPGWVSDPNFGNEEPGER